MKISTIGAMEIQSLLYEPASPITVCHALHAAIVLVVALIAEAAQPALPHFPIQGGMGSLFAQLLSGRLYGKAVKSRLDVMTSMTAMCAVQQPVNGLAGSRGRDWISMASVVPIFVLVSQGMQI